MSDHNSRGTKRKRSDRDNHSHDLTVGDTLARIQAEQAVNKKESDLQDTKAAESQRNGLEKHHGGAPSDDGWQAVDRATRRKQKKLENNYPALAHSATARLQSFVKISDLQNLVLYILADGTAPQWISVKHHQNFDKVVVLMVPGLDTDLFTGAVSLEDGEKGDENPGAQAGELVPPNDQSNGSTKLSLAPDNYYPSKLAHQKLPEPLKPLSEIFTHLWPIKTPGDFKRMHSPMYAMLSSPIPRTKEEKNKKGPKPPAESRSWTDKRTPITEYIATRSELVENAYALHPAHLNSETEREVEKARRHKAVQSPEDGWVDILDISSVTEGAAPESEIEAGSILQGRSLLVIDCEMVTTTVDRFALARISIIDWDGNVVLDELVKPTDPIKDYLTPYSGITKEMMDTATLTLADIQSRLRILLTPQTIIAGHSLDSDLRAVKISYPFIVDTSLLYPHPKGPPQKSSLKWLTQKYLSREIQQSSTLGHDSIEDAKACLDLIKQKCEKGKAWGTSDASGESIFKRLARTGKVDHRTKKDPALQEGMEPAPRRTGALVDRASPSHGFAASAEVAITCETDRDVVAGVERAINGVADGGAGGCDFVFARLRELEYVRGWAGRQDAADEREEVALADAVRATVQCIADVYAALPRRTGFIVLSGSGPPGDMVRLQKVYAAHKAEFLVKKWDELSVKWTDTEEQELKKAVERARRGVGFVGGK
ncbi:hypothetical protein K461DRAFT_263212 [Myriangium duriaei CBS 260.36]|uniref:Exonuclease domain-containing protein n=1 Tax=Myriangium duriaei CBS 260.36 TaxID=1168546 RepID=A0A9P4IVL9_9PEZI|nr:hypothetical protein K461DRAFT_263212 [Myriangium duriaei CBS 260.36]